MAGLLGFTLADLSGAVDSRKRQYANLVRGLLSDPGMTLAQLSAQDAEAAQRNRYTQASAGSVMPEVAQQGQQAMVDAALNVGGLLGMTKGHAPKGGTVGVNGQFYDGGMFLPSNPNTEKGAVKFPKFLRAGNVAEVAPREKAPRPFDGAQPVKGQAEFDWSEFHTNGTIKPFTGWDEYNKVPGLLEQAAAHAEAFNRGARWIKDGVYFDVSGNVLP